MGEFSSLKQTSPIKHSVQKPDAESYNGKIAMAWEFAANSMHF